MTITPISPAGLTMTDLSTSSDVLNISIANVLTTFGPTVVGSEQRPVQGTIL